MDRYRWIDGYMDRLIDRLDGWVIRYIDSLDGWVVRLDGWMDNDIWIGFVPVYIL